MKIITDVMSVIHRWLSLITFKSSERYWVERYKKGGNSGYGSYGQLAQYKADILNDFVKTYKIDTIIEYGCGDGNQLKLAEYPHYIGFDVSPDAVSMCKKIFNADLSKSFHLISDYKDEKADLTLSLDVIYHLVEDDVYERYMMLLFNSSNKYTIIYSTNQNTRAIIDSHIKHRNFTDWVKIELPSWSLIKHIPNEYSNEYRSKGGSIDFWIFENSHDGAISDSDG